ncbi:MAG: lactate utilization protein [Bacteroidia bacterium]|nr:lactate utilization protein [Bacteroidia bacterium]
MSKINHAINFELAVSNSIASKPSHKFAHKYTEQMAVSQFTDLEMAKKHAAWRRWKAVENMDKYLIEFESNLIKTGAKVLWAQNQDEAQKELASLLKKNYATEAYFEPSPNSQMSFIDQALKQQDVKQVSFSDYNAITSTVIAEANFIIADPGAIAFVSNSTNLQQAFSKARCVIAIATVSSILTHINDINLFVPLTASYTYLKNNTPLLSLLFGQRKPEESEGLPELNVLLIDDCSTVLNDTKARQSIWCINCQACANSCPVASTIGKETTLYQNPQQAIVNPIKHGFDSHGYLNHTTTLCGSCTEVCPVKININQLFIHNRAKHIQQNGASQKEKWFYLLWKKTMLNRNKYQIGKFTTYSWVMESVYAKTWNKSEKPIKPELTFQQMWINKFQ